MLFGIILFVFLGIFVETLLTLLTKAIVTGRMYWAACLSVLSTLICYIVISKVVDGNHLLEIFCFAVGNGLGTIAGMLCHKRFVRKP